MWFPVRLEICSLSYVVMLFIWLASLSGVFVIPWPGLTKVKICIDRKSFAEVWTLEGRGHEQVAVSLHTLCLRLMPWALVQPSLGEATRHSGWSLTYSERLEKEVTLLKRPFFTFILLLSLTAVYPVSLTECLQIFQTQHEHLPPGQPEPLTSQLNFLLLWPPPWCHWHLSKQIDEQMNSMLLSFLFNMKLISLGHDAPTFHCLA